MKHLVTPSIFLFALVLLFAPSGASAQTFEAASLDSYDWLLRTDLGNNYSTTGGITDAYASDRMRSVEVTAGDDATTGALTNDVVEVSPGDVLRFDVLLTEDQISNFSYIQPFVQYGGFGSFVSADYFADDFTAGEFTTVEVMVPDDLESADRVGIQIVNEEASATPTMYVDNIRNQDGEFLPVELTTFHPQVDGSNVTLHWRTESETGNAGFQIEQRYQGGKWEEAGYEEGHGTTSAPQVYAHRISDLAVGQYTFRLRQIDYDNDEQLSTEVSVEIGAEGAYALSSPYPNPARGTARFTLSVSREQAVRVALFNTLGQRVKTLHDGPLGANTAHPFAVEAGSLASGAYFVRVQGEAFATSRRIVLVR